MLTLNETLLLISLLALAAVAFLSNLVAADKQLVEQIFMNNIYATLETKPLNITTNNNRPTENSYKSISDDTKSSPTLTY